jgi:hypothetical protein
MKRIYFIVGLCIALLLVFAPKAAAETKAYFSFPEHSITQKPL